MTLSTLLRWLRLPALVLACWLGWRWVRHDLLVQGELRQRLAYREQVIGVLAKAYLGSLTRIPGVDTVYHEDKRTALAWASRYHALRDSLGATPSALPPPPILLAADSAVESCTQALRSCEHSIAVRDTALWQAAALVDSQRAQLRDLRKAAHRSLFGCVAGAVAYLQGIAPGVGCGLRF